MTGLGSEAPHAPLRGQNAQGPSAGSFMEFHLHLLDQVSCTMSFTSTGRNQLSAFLLRSLHEEFQAPAQGISP